VDAWHEMGADFEQDATGDLRVVYAPDEGRQRVLRRLLTNAGGYIWHLSYGAGLPAFVGQVVRQARLVAVIRTQMYRERAVLQSPAPDVQVANSLGSTTVTASIRYVDASTEVQTTTVVTL